MRVRIFSWFVSAQQNAPPTTSTPQIVYSMPVECVRLLILRSFDLTLAKSALYGGLHGPSLGRIRALDQQFNKQWINHALHAQMTALATSLRG